MTRFNMKLFPAILLKTRIHSPFRRLKVTTLIAALLFASGCNLQDQPIPILNSPAINQTVASINEVSPGQTNCPGPVVETEWPGPVIETDWPMFGRNPQRDKESPLDFANSNFKLLWTFKPSDHTFNYREGTNLWSESAIAINRKNRLEIVIGSYNRKVYGINGLTGELIWSFTTGDEVIATPVADKENTIIVSSDRKLYKLSANGDRQWAQQLQEWSHTSQPMTASSPALFSLENYGVLYAGGYYLNDTAFFGRRQEGWACLRSAETNKEIWSQFLRKSHVYGPAAGLVAGKEVLFYSTSDGLVCALNAKNGELIWKFTADQQIRSTPTFTYRKISQEAKDSVPVVLVSSRWGILWALDANSGESVWSYRAGHMCDSSPAIATLGSGKKIVIFGSYDRCLHGIYLDSGKRAWKFETKGIILSSPAVANVNGHKAVFFSSMDNHLYSIEAATGKILWSYKTGPLPWPFFKRGDAVFSSPVICRNADTTDKEERTILIFPAHDGTIYAFTPAASI
jgi:outer membrane protein assembly factor BamB